MVEQYDTPAEILGLRLATPFVADFVGAYRGVRRLAVVKVEEADLADPPVVPPSASMDEVRRVALDSSTPRPRWSSTARVGWWAGCRRRPERQFGG